MWDFAPDGDLYFEKFLYGFAADILRRWNILETSHSLTVIYFSRMVAQDSGQKKIKGQELLDQNQPMDFYKIALEEENISAFTQEKILLILKKEFMEFPRMLPMCGNRNRVHFVEELFSQNYSEQELAPSTALQGNFLEALNVTLNVLEKHYLDRDLSHTGNSIVTISPGSGVFQVDPNLMAITKQRMMDNGIGMDMVSLSQPPLHTVPLFIHKDPQNPRENIYDVPHWMHLSFLDPRGQIPRLINSSSKLPKVLEAILKNEFKDSPEIHSNNNQTQQEEEEQKDAGKEERPDGTFNKLKVWSTPESLDNSVSITDPWCSPLQFHWLKTKNPTRYSIEEEDLHLSDSDGAHYEKDTISEDLLQKCDAYDQEIFSKNLFHQSSSQEVNMSFETTESLKQRLQQLRVNTNTIGCSVESMKSIFSDQTSPSSRDESRQIQFPLSTEESWEKPPLLLSSVSNSGGALALNQQAGGETGKGLFVISGGTGEAAAGTAGGGSTSSSRGIAFTAFHYGRLQQQRPRCRTDESETRPGPWLDGGAHTRRANHSRTKSTELISASRRVSLKKPTRSMDVTSDSNLQTPPSQRNTSLLSNLSTSISIPENSLSKSFNSPSLLSTQIQGRHDDSVLGSPIAYSSTASPDTLNTARKEIKQDISVSPSSVGTDHSLASITGTSGDNLLKEGIQRLTPVHSDSTRKGGSSGKLQHKPRFGYTKQQPPNMYQEVDPKYQFLQLKKKFFSPFCREDEEDLLRQRTHNRRRWSHVFPYGEVEFKRIPGPNYKSLCQPANLPLTVDYFPTETDLKNNFLERQYVLTLEESDSTFYKSEEELLRELVCQRLNQDFQAVVQSPTLKKASASCNDYILSMGHCIHLLNQTSDHQIEVKHYLARFGNNSDPGNSFNYTYFLWNPLIMQWQKVTRTFVRYVDEFNWNHSDQIVQGHLTDFTDAVKFRRIDFCIIPSGTSKSMKAEEEHITNLLAFIDYLNSRADEHTEMKGIEVLRRLTREEGSPEPDISYEKWIPKHDIKVCFKNQKNHIDKWLFCNCDKILDPIKCYHVAIHWLVCTGVKVFDFVASLLRKANQLNLNLAQIQHNVRTKYLNLHAFQAGTHIEIPNAQLRMLAEDSLLDHFEFARDSGQETDWKKYGWGHVQEEQGKGDSLGSALAKHAKRRTKWFKERIFYRQYIHYSGSVYIRVSPTGFVWMTNTIKPNNNNYQGLTIDEKISVSEKLFVRINDHIANLVVASQIVHDIIHDLPFSGTLLNQKSP